MSEKKSEQAPVVTLTMDDEHKLKINVNKEIGVMMDADDVSEDLLGQKYYAIEALLFACAALSKEMVDAGMDMPQVIEHVVSALSRDLSAMFPNIKFDYVDNVSPKGSMPSKSGKMPS